MNKLKQQFDIIAFTVDDKHYYPASMKEEDWANEDGLVWDEFAGSDCSKMFGIYTNCQACFEEVEEIVFSDKILLLQVGENGFNDDGGVFSILIPKEDLLNKNFENCECVWGHD